MPKYRQSEEGYRFNEDSIHLKNLALEYDISNFADLGSGCGVIAVEIMRERPDIEGTAVEIQKEMAINILENARAFGVNNLTVINDNMVSWSQRCREKFDLVVTNPPYYKKGEGREPENQEKLIARHEVEIDLPYLFYTVSNILQDDGDFLLVLPSTRLFEFYEITKENKYHINRLRFISSGGISRTFLAAISRKKKNQFVCECIK